MERVIDVKVHNNSGGIVDLEKKIYDVLIIDDNHVKRKLNVDLDNPKLKKYLKDFEEYLINKKDKFEEKALSNTFKKRIRNNLIAFPFYIISFLGIGISVFGVGELLGMFLFFSSLGVGVISIGLANERSFYTKPEDEEKIQKLEIEIIECKRLQNEVERINLNKKLEREAQIKKDLQNKKKMITPKKEREINEYFELEKLRIRAEAYKMKHEVENRKKFDEMQERFFKIEMALKEVRMNEFVEKKSNDVLKNSRRSR